MYKSVPYFWRQDFVSTLLLLGSLFAPPRPVPVVEESLRHRPPDRHDHVHGVDVGVGVALVYVVLVGVGGVVVAVVVVIVVIVVGVGLGGGDEGDHVEYRHEEGDHLKGVREGTA